MLLIITNMCRYFFSAGYRLCGLPVTDDEAEPPVRNHYVEWTA